MSKKLFCQYCNELVIEIERGKVKPNIIITCNKCLNDFIIPKSDNNSKGSDMPDFFKEFLFKEKI